MPILLNYSVYRVILHNTQRVHDYSKPKITLIIANDSLIIIAGHLSCLKWFILTSFFILHQFNYPDLYILYSFQLPMLNGDLYILYSFQLPMLNGI